MIFLRMVMCLGGVQNDILRVLVVWVIQSLSG
jgi:hypothetical protein